MTSGQLANTLKADLPAKSSQFGRLWPTMKVLNFSLAPEAVDYQTWYRLKAVPAIGRHSQ